MKVKLKESFLGWKAGRIYQAKMTTLDNEERVAIDLPCSDITIFLKREDVEVIE